MKELSLFTGAGGGLLASRFLGWNTVCAVEINEYCRKVLQARQRDGLLDSFAIYDDIKQFDKIAADWKGVDIVSGGFPCQTFSSAARGRNNAEDLWPYMYSVIRSVNPTYVFAENVKEKPIKQAAHDLWSCDYTCRYMRLSSSDLGAPHQRDRYWLVAYANPNGESRCPEHVETPVSSTLPSLEWWQDDSGAMGIPDGMANRVDRLGALGNGQVPIVAATAWRVLSEGIDDLD